MCAREDVDALRSLWLEEDGDSIPFSPSSFDGQALRLTPETPPTQRSLLSAFAAGDARSRAERRRDGSDSRAGWGASSQFGEDSGVDEEEIDSAEEMAQRQGGVTLHALPCLPLSQLGSRSNAHAGFSEAQVAYIKAAAAQAVADAMEEAMSWRLLAAAVVHNAKKGAAEISPRLVRTIEWLVPKALRVRSDGGLRRAAAAAAAGE